MTVTNYTFASSAIAAIAYDDEENTLYLTFTDGRSYVLEDFPEIELERWMGSASMGGYWNAFLRGNY